MEFLTEINGQLACRSSPSHEFLEHLSRVFGTVKALLESTQALHVALEGKVSEHLFDLLAQTAFLENNEGKAYARPLPFHVLQVQLLLTVQRETDNRGFRLNSRQTGKPGNKPEDGHPLRYFLKCRPRYPILSRKP